MKTINQAANEQEDAIQTIADLTEDLAISRRLVAELRAENATLKVALQKANALAELAPINPNAGLGSSVGRWDSKPKAL